MNARTSLARLRTRRELLGAFAALIAMPLAGACSSFVDQLHVVDISDQKGFQPAALTIRTGDTVRWKNLGIHPHTVTAGSSNGGNGGGGSATGQASPPAGGQSFDSGDILPGRTWSYTFNTPGQYQYASTNDQGQAFQGTITVNG